MATKKRKAKNKKPHPAQSRSPILSSVTATVLNMVATSATLGVCVAELVVVKHFT
jgi:hypothetical protein